MFGIFELLNDPWVRVNDWSELKLVSNSNFGRVVNYEEIKRFVVKVCEKALDNIDLSECSEEEFVKVFKERNDDFFRLLSWLNKVYDVIPESSEIFEILKGMLRVPDFAGYEKDLNEYWKMMTPDVF